VLDAGNQLWTSSTCAPSMTSGTRHVSSAPTAAWSSPTNSHALKEMETFIAKKITNGKKFAIQTSLCHSDTRQFLNLTAENSSRVQKKS